MDFTTDTDFTAHFKAYREYVAVNAEEGLLNFSEFRNGLLGITPQVVVTPENVIEVPEPVVEEAVTEEVVTEVAPEPEVEVPEVIAPKAVAKGTPNKWAHEMNGQKYNGVLVVSYNAEMSELKGKAYSNAVCPACGATFTSQSYGIKTGVKTHCGCMRKKK